MPVKFPICRNGIEVLNASSITFARAYREGDARRLCGQNVAFVSEFVGPEFASHDLALDSFKGLVEDERPDRRFNPEPEDRYFSIVCRFRRAPGRPKKRKSIPAPTTLQEGEPPAPSPFPTYYQLSVSYWKVLDGRRPETQATLSAFSDRRSRRKAKGKFSADELAAIANTPLRATAAQLAMDFGLFERHDPDKPGWLIADE